MANPQAWLEYIIELRRMVLWTKIPQELWSEDFRLINGNKIDGWENMIELIILNSCVYSKKHDIINDEIKKIHCTEINIL